MAGYQGGEFNKVGNFLEVRQANAHAWAEVWLDKKGWVRVDPTTAIAPERIEQNINIEEQIASGTLSFSPADDDLIGSSAWLRKARQLWGSVDYSWQRWVINYSADNQSLFLSSFGINNIKVMLFWLAVIIFLITAIMAIILLRQKQKTTDKILIVYNRFCDKLAKAGMIRRTGEGAVDFAARVKKILPEQTKAIDDITRLFVKLRYGRNPTENDLTELSKQVSLFTVSLGYPRKF